MSHLSTDLWFMAPLGSCCWQSTSDKKEIELPQRALLWLISGPISVEHLRHLTSLIWLASHFGWFWKLIMSSVMSTALSAAEPGATIITCLLLRPLLVYLMFFNAFWVVDLSIFAAVAETDGWRRPKFMGSFFYCRFIHNRDQFVLVALSIQRHTLKLTWAW